MTGAGDRVYRTGGRCHICRRSPRGMEVCPGRKKSHEHLSGGGGGSSSDGNGDLDSQSTELQEDLESKRAASKKKQKLRLEPDEKLKTITEKQSFLEGEKGWHRLRKQL